MRAKNAFFNIERLGAVCRRFHANYYGPVASRLQQGLPSDRLIAEWWIRSARAKRALAGKSPRATARQANRQVAIPTDFDTLAKDEPAQARALQAEVRRRLTELLRRKFMITGFTRGERKGVYLLDRHE